MTESLYLLLFKTQAFSLMLLKVILLLKYSIFLRYKTGEWKVQHLLFFPQKEIDYSDCTQSAKVKKTQNTLSILFILLILTIVLIRNITSTHF